jgi:dUTP pyrophosphatase
MEIRVTACDGFLPHYHSADASGADLAACIDEPLVLAPGQRALVSTGVFIEIPPGYEGQVRPRSGLANKFGVTMLNTPGTIDADYRGEIKVIIINLGNEEFKIERGDRIAQLVIAPVVRARFRPVAALTPTGREDGGFGSTGV